ncbi:MAG: site-2 protease family protein [Thermaerobacter sp.]|nr:site-2 protease family protein [Thermaerobacter sp.]
MTSGQPPNWRRRLSAIGAAILLALAKLKTIALLALHIPFLGSGLTFLLSAWVYGASFGWTFGVGFAVLLLLHELGHFVAIRAYGLPAGAPVFIPFLGAAIFLRQQPQSPQQEFVIAAAGPLAGTLASAAVWVLGALLGQDVLRTLAYFGFFLQAFNLIPVWPLDGGRMVAAVDRRIWWVGVPVLLIMAWLGHSPIGILIVAVLLWQFFTQRHMASPDLPVPPLQRLAFGAVWLGLLVVNLGLGRVSGG